MVKYNRPTEDEYGDFYRGYVELANPNEAGILAHLKKQGLVVLNYLRTLTDEQAEYRYAPEKWSIKELIGHMVDMERMFAFRTLWIARGDGQEQPGVDENAWAAASNAGKRALPELWREHHVARTDHVYLFRSLDRTAVARVGKASGNSLSVRAVPWIIAGHERHHLQVLEERYGAKLSW